MFAPLPPGGGSRRYPGAAFRGRRAGDLSAQITADLLVSRNRARCAGCSVFALSAVLTDPLTRAFPTLQTIQRGLAV